MVNWTLRPRPYCVRQISTLRGDPPRHGVKPGLFLNATTARDGLSDWQMACYVVSLSTNFINVILPPESSRCDISLTGPDGKPVLKSMRGKRFKSENVKIPRGYGRGGYVHSVASYPLPSMPGGNYRVRDLFKVEEPGDYTLEISWRMIIVVDNKMVITYFSPIKKTIRFDKP